MVEVRLKYLLDVRTFLVDKLPDDGILVPKDVGVSNWYEVCFVMFYCIIISAFCWFPKQNMEEQQYVPAINVLDCTMS